jgi:hypothetical protein
MQSFTCTALLGIPLDGFKLRAPGCHGLWPAFPRCYARYSPITLRSRNPGEINPPGLGCSAFARHYLRNQIRFLFLGLLRCFTSPRVASPDYEFIQSIILSYQDWVVPFGNPRISACYAAPRGLSQHAASFIASWHQGIHRIALSSLITKITI